MMVKSNAKLNLNLKVVGKIGNLHELESIMVPINLYDYIEIKESKEDRIFGMDIPFETNLLYKALCKVRSLFKIDRHIEITIDKNIPIFSGMGGGSGNAAAVILALNELWNLKMTTDEMVSIGKEIGSDVPFFIINKPSYVYGTGEKIVQINNFPKVRGVLVFDDDKASTKEVFENVDKFPFSNKKEVGIENEMDYSIYNIEYVNDLEKGLDEGMYEKVQTIKSDLKSYGALYTLMTGSGGCVFGVFENEKNVERCQTMLSKKYKIVCKFETL